MWKTGNISTTIVHLAAVPNMIYYYFKPDVRLSSWHRPLKTVK
jgi:hypothetical protein